MEVFGGEVSGIKQRTLHCQELLSRSVETENDWIRDLTADFNIWIASVGALAHDHLSIDYRLRGFPDVKHVVEDLLDILAIDIEHATSCEDRSLAEDVPMIFEYEPNENETPKSSSLSISSLASWSSISGSSHVSSRGSPLPDVEPGQINNPLENDSSHQSAPSETWLSIRATLDKLVKVATAIRSAGAQHRSIRAARYRGPDADDFEKHLNYIVSREYPRATVYLRNRLVESNLRRLNAFSYAQQHFSHLASGTTHQAPIAPKDSKKNVQQPYPTTDLEFPTQSLKNLQFSNSQAPTHTSASHVGPKGIQLPFPEPMAASAPTVLSRGTFLEAKHEVCRPPSVSKNQRHFICPFCCQTLPVIYLEKATWNGHVKKDLQPYICLFENCEQAHELFSSSKEWLNHMQFEHLRQYQCPDASHRSLPLFTSRKLFKEHMLEVHKGTFATKQLPTIVDMQTRPGLLPFHDCPFCKWPSVPRLQDHMRTKHLAYRFHDQKVPFTADKCPLCDWPEEKEAIQRRAMFVGAEWRTESDEGDSRKRGLNQEQLILEGQYVHNSSPQEGHKRRKLDDSHKLANAKRKGISSTDDDTDPEADTASDLEPIDVINHIAEHLLAFSLKVLRWAGNEKDDSASILADSVETAPSYQRILQGPKPVFDERTQLDYTEDSEDETYSGETDTNAWSLSEKTEFPALLEHFGTDWQGIANWMTSKTYTEVKDHFYMHADTKPEWEAIASNANEKRKRGESRGPLLLLNIQTEPLLCKEKSCRYKTPFRDQPDLDRHYSTQHRGYQLYVCPYESCETPSKRFETKDKVLKHITETLHEDDNYCPFPFCRADQVSKNAEFTSRDEIERHFFKYQDRLEHNYAKLPFSHKDEQDSVAQAHYDQYDSPVDGQNMMSDEFDPIPRSGPGTPSAVPEYSDYDLGIVREPEIPSAVPEYSDYDLGIVRKPETPFSPYPIPIPADKLEEAVEIYIKYLAAIREELLAEQSRAALNSHLHPSEANHASKGRLKPSQSSSKHLRDESGPTSDQDAMSDVSSVVDFGDSSKSTNTNAKRKRRPFLPSKRLKTRLIRLLGSCNNCRAKRVPCPLAHQDIEHLQRIIDQRANNQSPNRSQSPAQHGDPSGVSSWNRWEQPFTNPVAAPEPDTQEEPEDSDDDHRLTTLKFKKKSRASVDWITKSRPQPGRGLTSKPGGHWDRSGPSQGDLSYMGAQLARPSSPSTHPLTAQSPIGDWLSDIAPAE